MGEIYAFIVFWKDYAEKLILDLKSKVNYEVKYGPKMKPNETTTLCNIYQRIELR